MQDPHTLERELVPLQKIPDQYEKILLTMDRDYIEDYNGIRKQNIVDFLLEKSSEEVNGVWSCGPGGKTKVYGC